MKYICKILGKIVLGTVIILFINMMGSLINFSLPLNTISILLSGFLGIPGVILVIILHFLY